MGSDSTGTQALHGAFAAGRSQGRALLMPFLVCGYPDERRFLECVRAAGEAGADMIEIGLPFSDPIMDGPVIAEAANRVLARGQTVSRALDLVREAAGVLGKPIAVMTYYNILLQAGLDDFARRCTTAGASGVIVPDLTVEEAAEWRSACDGVGLAPIFMAAVTSPPARLAAVAEASRGFIYAASTLGVTGVRDELSSRARGLVESLRRVTDKPIAVGIGVSTTAQAREVASYADGVIVGSAVVRAAGGSEDPVPAVRDLVASLRAAV